MFLGHFAVALASKKLEPDVSLATSFLAAQLADTLWPVLILTGVEHVSIVPGDTVVTPFRFDSYPWSHSLLMLGLWGALLSGLHFAKRRRRRAAVVLFLLVVSHWVLDVASHRPDMPLTPWTTRVFGLGLWNSRPATLVVELALFVGGVILAVGSTRAKDGVGRLGLPIFLSFLLVAYLASMFGPPPPDTSTLGWTALAAPAILLPVIAWVERHRSPR